MFNVFMTSQVCVFSVIFLLALYNLKGPSRQNTPKRWSSFFWGWIFIQGTQKVHGLSSLLASQSSRERQEKRRQRWRPSGHKASQSAQLGNRYGKRMKEAICFGRCMEMCTYDLCISLLCRKLFIILALVIYIQCMVYSFAIYMYTYLHLHDCCTCIFCTCIHPRCILLMIWDYHGCPYRGFSSPFPLTKSKLLGVVFVVSVVSTFCLDNTLS